MTETVVQRSDLLRVLVRASAAIARRTSIPVLSLARLSAAGGVLEVVATDLFLGVRATCAAEGELEPCLVDATTLLGIVKALPVGPVKLAVEYGAALALKAGRSRFKLPVRPVDDFPPLPVPPAELVEVDAPVLAELIARTGYSVSGDESRPHLAALLLEGEGGVLRAVSTDGHRLSKAEAPGPDLPSCMVPARGVTEVARLASSGPLRVGADRGVLFVEAGDVVLSVKLGDESFPPYEKVIPTKASRRLAMPRGALVDALRRVVLVASRDSHGVRLTLGEGSLRVDAESQDRGDGSEDLEVDYAGGPLTIAANARYLLDVLTALDEDEVTLEMGGDLDPIAIKAPGFVGVVMPMRV